MQACETSPPHFAHLWLSYFGKGNYFLTIAQSSAGSPLAPFPVALPGRCRWHFPDGLSGSELAFSIPFAPVGPLRTAFPGSKSVILIPRALPWLISRLSEPACPSGIALWLRIGFFNPVCPCWPPSDSLPGIKISHFDPPRASRWLPGLNFAISEPKYPSCTPFQGLLGLKIGQSDPPCPSGWLPGLNFAISELKYPSCTPFQGPPGLKTRIPETADPSRCRLLGLQVRSRSAQHSVLSRGQRQAAYSPALRLRLSLRKVRLRRPLRPLPLSGAGAKPARTCQPCALRTGAALLAYLTVGCP